MFSDAMCALIFEGQRMARIAANAKKDILCGVGLARDPAGIHVGGCHFVFNEDDMAAARLNTMSSLGRTSRQVSSS